jgi:putative flippase GtrA
MSKQNKVSNSNNWIHHNKKKIFIWILIGLIIVLLSTLSLYLLIGLLKLPIEIATIISAETLVIFRYYLLSTFIFKSKTENLVLSLYNFHISSLTGFLIWWFVTNYLANKGFHYICANLFGICFSVLFNFASHFFWIWPNEENDKKTTRL